MCEGGVLLWDKEVPRVVGSGNWGGAICRAGLTRGLGKSAYEAKTHRSKHTEICPGKRPRMTHWMEPGAARPEHETL